MHELGNFSGYPQPAPQPPYHRSNTGLGCSAFARHYLRNHYCFLFLGVLRCFSSPRSPHAPMYSVHDTEALPPAGFPIRKSPDQSLFSGSPRLIAAYHVLHRLPLPRHPPYALSSLTIKNSKSNQSTLRTSARTGFKPVPTSVCLTTNLLCNCQRTTSVRRKSQT
jgi:hypothetical protein